ncbi:MAG TPA: LON peptidase substrate-binding domain-containing protein, partial [Myxococcales bacterium]|nr:LON peptidase substrate-binding domain-containing protein [Myxococcales bacterium]
MSERDTIERKPPVGRGSSGETPRRGSSGESAVSTPEEGRKDGILSLPVLPIKNTVLFPYLIMPLAVGRPLSVRAVRAAQATEEKEILVIAQRDASIDEPKQEDLYTIGTRAVIKKVKSGGDNVLEVIVLGMERVVLIKLERQDNYLQARVRPSPIPEEKSIEIEALRREVLELALRANELSSPRTGVELEQFANEEPMRLVYLLSSVINLELDK